MDDPGRDPGDPARAPAARAARRRPLRDLRPERPLPPRDQPQQPAEEADRAARARRDRAQREAHAAGGGRRALRQRPPRPRAARGQQPAAQVALRHAQGQAGPLPPEPARQARRLLGPLGDRGRPGAEAAPVRAAEEDGARAVQAVHLQQAREGRPGHDDQGRQGDGRAAAARGVGLPRGGHPRAPGAAEPRAHAPPPRDPGLRADAGRGQGDQDPPARLHGVQRRLRRRPDGRARAAVARGADRGERPDAELEQHPLARERPADRDPEPGHRARLLLPHQGEEGHQGRGPRVLLPRGRDDRARAQGGGDADVRAPALHGRADRPHHRLRRPGRDAHRAPAAQGPGDQHHGRPRDLQRLAARGHAVRERAAAQEGPAAARAVLLPALRPREDGADARRHQGPRLLLRDARRHLDRHRRPDHPRGQGEDGPGRAEGGARGREAVSRRRHHQRRALQQGHLDLVRHHREGRRRDVQGDGAPGQGRHRVQPDLHHGRLGRARIEAADPPARRDARPDGQALGRDHREPDHLELPRRPDRAAVLRLDARRAQGPRRHGAQDGRLRLPDAAPGRRQPGRDHQRARLRDRGRPRDPSDHRVGRGDRGAARPHHRPRQPRQHQGPDRRQHDRQGQRGDRRGDGERHPGGRHREGADPLGAVVRVGARRVRAVLRSRPRDRQARRDGPRGGRDRGAVDRRARHAAHDAHVPHRRHRERTRHSRRRSRRRTPAS